MPTSKAQQKAVAKYETANYDKFLVRTPKGQKEEIQAHVAAKGYKSFNAFVLEAISAKMATDISRESDMPKSTDSDMVQVLQEQVEKLEKMLAERENEAAVSVKDSLSTDSDITETPTDISILRCLNCGKEIEGTNKKKKFCSDNCRKYHHRKMKDASS